MGAVHRGRLGDFVRGQFAVPQTPVGMGMGDFVRAQFAVPQTPVGMSGCGSGCSCGPCSHGGGMGTIDFSLAGDGIAQAINSSLTIPNWAVYAAGALAAYMMFFESPKRRGR